MMFPFLLHDKFDFKKYHDRLKPSDFPLIIAILLFYLAPLTMLLLYQSSIYLPLFMSQAQLRC